MESSPRKGTQRRGTEGARGWMTVRNRVVAAASRGERRGGARLKSGRAWEVVLTIPGFSLRTIFWPGRLEDWIPDGPAGQL